MAESLDYRQEAFRAEPCVGTARFYATELFSYFADEMIGKDTLREGLIEIADGLTESRNDLGWEVRTEVKLV
jgi:hypothetical protein